MSPKSDPKPAEAQPAATALSRRHLFAGAGAAGALAVVAAALPTGPAAEPAPLAQAPEPEGSGGYQLTEHVKRYYQTARV